MKMNHKNVTRTLAAAAVMMAAVATMATGAFAAEDDGVVAGYMPPMPMDQMIQGDIAMYSAGEQQSAVVEETTTTTTDDSVVVGYLPPMPMEEMIQGDVMMISMGGETTEEVPLAAGLTMTGPFWKQVLFTARQDGRVLTLDAPEDTVTVRGTIGDLRAQMNQGISTLSVVTNKNSTTLNLTLMCEGYSDKTSFTLRQIGSRTILTIGGRCRRDLLIGR